MASHPLQKDARDAPPGRNIKPENLLSDDKKDKSIIRQCPTTTPVVGASTLRSARPIMAIIGRGFLSCQVQEDGTWHAKKLPSLRFT
jgi:hypothetical protein